MPELPEVETTVRGLNKHIRGLFIKDVWSDYPKGESLKSQKGSPLIKQQQRTIKNREYFTKFRKAIIGKEILNTERRAKNIIMNLSGGISVLIHMKMTGHFLYGKYKKNSKLQKTNPKQIQNSKFKNQNEGWIPTEKGPLNDPMNRFIRMVWTLSNGRHLAFSDLRRFAKICYFPTSKKSNYDDLKNLGPEPLAKNFSFKIFSERLSLRPSSKIKQVLMDQKVLAGIGNIYSDEILFESNIHPFSEVKNIPEPKKLLIFKTMKKILEKAIKVGGDSASDFRLLDGRPAGFQNFHKAYHQTGKKCLRNGCDGRIHRLKIGGRSAHFCPIHQKKY